MSEKHNQKNRGSSQLTSCSSCFQQRPGRENGVEGRWVWQHLAPAEPPRDCGLSRRAHRDEWYLWRRLGRPASSSQEAGHGLSPSRTSRHTSPPTSSQAGCHLSPPHSYQQPTNQPPSPLSLEPSSPFSPRVPLLPTHKPPPPPQFTTG